VFGLDLAIAVTGTVLLAIAVRLQQQPSAPARRGRPQRRPARPG
jgi:hypothetical protein